LPVLQYDCGKAQGHARVPTGKLALYLALSLLLMASLPQAQSVGQIKPLWTPAQSESWLQVWL
jgi:hypothetical protein